MRERDRAARSAAELFAGDGEVRALGRALDWGATALGWPATWSPALRIATRAMLDSPFPICLWSGPTYALVYNDAYRRILAAKHPAALGRPGADVWSEIWAEIEAQFAQVRGGGPPLSFENARFVMARLEGGQTEDAWFDYSLSTLRDEDGSVAAVLNICPETTGRVIAERALELERARLENVFQRAPSFIVSYRGPDNVFEFVNDAYYQIVGHRDVIGKPLLDALPEIAGQGFEALLEGVRTTGERWVGRESPLVVQRIPGAPLETRYLDMVFQPLTDGDGARTGVVVHGFDITQHVLARREAEQARDRSDRLQALTASLAATTTLEAVAEVVVAQGMAATGAATAMIGLRRESESGDGGEEMAILRQTGLGVAMSQAYARVPISTPIPTAASVRTGDAYFIEEGAALRAAFPAATGAWDELGSQALATVPLSVGGVAVGAISFTFTAPRVFPSVDREFFLALGRQAAQALERVRLGAAEHAARGRAEMLQRVTAALAQAQTTAAVGRMFSREMTTLLGAETAWVGLVTADGGGVEALGWSGHSDRAAERWRRLPLDAGIALTDVVRSGAAQWWRSREALATAYPERADLIRTMTQDGVAVLPIVDHGDAIADSIGGAPRGAAVGGIVIGFDSPQRFDADTRAFFLALAQQCAQAVARARAYEAEQMARLEAEAARGSAEAASLAKSEFLAVMSHELRTPLNAIGGYAEILEMGIRGPVTTEQRFDLERIQRAQRHLLGLINGVLNYAKVDAGAVHYDVADVTLDEVLATCEALVAPQARAKGLTLHTEASDRTLRARADGEKVQQIALNLLSNAVKFTEPGGRVSISYLSTSDATVAIQVSDSGLGIAADQLERVFQPFVQIDASLTRTHEGTGLGLAISRDLAVGMGGNLVAESVLGGGSTFTLTLPRA